jgi:nucleolar protein 58
MRVREWYGWHFPEMTKIVTDNIAYSKVVKFMGLRENAAGLDFSGVPLDEATEQELKDAAVVSMGTDVSDEDMMYIANLADQVRDLWEPGARRECKRGNREGGVWQHRGLYHILTFPSYFAQGGC